MVASLVGLAILAAVAAVCFWPDSEAPDDADLMPKPVAAGEEAFRDFQALGASIDASPEERAFITAQSSGGVTDAPRVEALLARNKSALELFGRFASHRSFSDPSFRDLSKVTFETPIPQFHPVVTAARLTALRSDLLLAEGKADEALQEALRAHDAGRMMMSSGSQLIEFLVGVLILEDAVKRVRAAALSPGVSRAGRMAAARRLGAPTRGAASLQEALRYEYVMAAWTAEHLIEMAGRDERFKESPAAPLARVGVLYNPKATRALFAERYRLIVGEAGKPCRDASLPPLERPSLVPRPNLVGIIVHHIAIPEFGKIYGRRCASDAAVASAAVDIAVESYRRDHDGAPPSLAALVPEYLDAVPADPHTGEPPAYAAKVY